MLVKIPPPVFAIERIGFDRDLRILRIFGKPKAVHVRIGRDGDIEEVSPPTDANYVDVSSNIFENKKGLLIILTPSEEDGFSGQKLLLIEMGHATHKEPIGNGTCFEIFAVLRPKTPPIHLLAIGSTDEDTEEL